MINKRLAFMLAVFLAALALYDFDHPSLYFLLLSALLAFSLLAAVILRITGAAKPHFADVLLISLGMALALILSSANFFIYEKSAPDYDGCYAEVVGVVSACSHSDNFVSFNIDAESINDEPSNLVIAASIYYPEELENGDTVSCQGELQKADDPLFGYSKKDSMTAYGSFLSCNVEKLTLLSKGTNPLTNAINGIRNSISSRLSELQNSDIAKAIVIGDKSEVQKDFKKALQNAGVSHTLAISGLHLSILIVSLYSLMKLLSVGIKLRTIVTILATLAYMAIAGFSPGIVRAGVMLIIYFGSLALRSESDSITSLLIAAGIILIFNRYAIASLGFQLSFLATLGIIAAGAPFANWLTSLSFIKNLKNGQRLQRIFARLISYIFSVVAITFAAVFFTLPVTMIHFSEISLIAPLSNLVIVTVFEPALIFTALFLTFALFFSGIPFLSLVPALFGHIADLLLSLYRFLVFSFEGFPGATGFVNYPFVKYVVAFAVVAALLFGIFKVKPKYFFIAPLTVIILFIGWRAIYIATDDSVHIAVLDIYCDKKLIALSQGEAVMLEPKTLGYKTEKPVLSDCLDYMGIESLDSYVISSLTDKLPGQLEIVLSLCEVEKLYLPNPQNEKEEFIISDCRTIADENGCDIREYEQGASLSLDIMDVLPEVFSKSSRGFSVDCLDKSLLFYHNTSRQSSEITNSEYDIVIGCGKSCIGSERFFGSAEFCALEGKYYTEETAPEGFFDLSEAKMFILELAPGEPIHVQ